MPRSSACTLIGDRIARHREEFIRAFSDLARVGGTVAEFAEASRRLSEAWRAGTANEVQRPPPQPPDSM